MNELTPAQAKVLKWIARYQAKHGFSPSVRDIVAGMGWASPNAAQCHLKYLEQKGAIRRTPGISRSIVIL